MKEYSEQKQIAQKAYQKMEWTLVLIGLVLFAVHMAINYYYPENNGTGMGSAFILIGIILNVRYVEKYYEFKLK